jgi:hypothetical protein
VLCSSGVAENFKMASVGSQIAPSRILDTNTWVLLRINGARCPIANATYVTYDFCKRVSVAVVGSRVGLSGDGTCDDEVSHE